MKQWLICISIFLSLSFNAFANPELDRGLAAAKMGKWDIARRSFEKALEKDPLSPAILYNLGLAHAKSGNHILGVVFLEAYLAAHPDVNNVSEVRSTIAQLEVLAESQMDDLFERALEILDAAPFERSYGSQGKWRDARLISSNFASIGKFNKAWETEALSMRYSGKVGGRMPGVFGDEFYSNYAFTLAGIGMFDEAWHHYSKLRMENFRSRVAYAIFTSPLINNKELRILFDTAVRSALMFKGELNALFHTYNGGFDIAARNLWLAGDEQGLLYLAQQLKDEGSIYNPSRLELAHGLLGLGHKKEALELAKEVSAYTEAPMPAQVIRFLLDYLWLNDCYEQNPRLTLRRMLLTRQNALSGNLESAALGKNMIVHLFDDLKGRGLEVTKEMRQNKAWSFAFAYYASKEVDKAIATLAAAGEDITSFLKIILRHATITDPRYAVTIAKQMDPPHLGPFLLQEEAKQAEAKKDTARAKILQLEAKKLAKQLGGVMPSNSTALRQWLELAVLFSGNSTLSSLSAVLKQVALGGKVPFEPLSLQPDFVSKQHDYRCPPPPGKGSHEPVPVRDRAQEYSRAPGMSHAAAYIGKALLHIRGARERVKKRK